MTGAHAYRRPPRPPRKRPSYTGLRRWWPAFAGVGLGLIAFASVRLGDDPASRPHITAAASTAPDDFTPWDIVNRPTEPTHPLTGTTVTKALTPAPHAVATRPVRRRPVTVRVAPRPQPTAAARIGVRTPLPALTAPAPTAGPVHTPSRAPAVHTPQAIPSPSIAPAPTPSPTPSVEPTPTPTDAGPSTTPPSTTWRTSRTPWWRVR